MHNTLQKLTRLQIALALIVLAHAWLLTCCLPAHADAPAADYTVQEGDALLIYVFDEEVLTGTYLVGAGGTIPMAMVGQVAVVGKTLAEVRDLLRKQLAQIIRAPFVTVAIDEVKSARKVFVSGYVENKGAVMLRPGSNVRDAVVTAQSQARADLSKVRLSRRGEQPLEIDLSGLRDGRVLGAPVPVQYGDVIYVPRLDSIISVLGEVKQPGSLTLPTGERLTVLEAIARVGEGFAVEADTNAALLLRKGLDQPIRINLRALIKDGDVSQNHELQGGDVLLIQKANQIAVVGQVNSPTTFYSPEPIKVTEAIIRAGGFNESSGLAEASIFRDGEYIPVDLESLWKEGDMSKDIALQAGDTLIVPEKEPEEIVLLGALTNVGSVSIANMRNTGVLKIVMMAGPTEKADLRKVQVYRGGQQMTVDIKKIEEKGDMSGDVQLQPGDVVIVNDAEKVYLLGAFGRPGVYPYDPDLSLFDYLSTAALGAGFGHSVGSLVRVKETGETEVTKIDMSKIKEGQLPPDVTVQAGDIIYFPPVVARKGKTMWDYIRENLWLLQVFNVWD